MTFTRPLADMTLDELDAESATEFRIMQEWARKPRDAQIAQRSTYLRAADRHSAIQAELRRPERIRERGRARAQDERDTYDSDPAEDYTDGD